MLINKNVIGDPSFRITDSVLRNLSEIVFTNSKLFKLFKTGAAIPHGKKMECNGCCQNKIQNVEFI